MDRRLIYPQCPNCGGSVTRPFRPANAMYAVTMMHPRRGAKNCKIVLRVYPDGHVEGQTLTRDTSFEAALLATTTDAPRAAA